MAQNRNVGERGDMTVQEAGHLGGEKGGQKGGQRVKELIEKGKRAEGNATTDRNQRRR